MTTAGFQIGQQTRRDKPQSPLPFSIATYHDELEFLPSGFVPWHWHSRVELAVCLGGEVVFYVEGRRFLLHAGEGLFLNSEALHRVAPGREGRFLSVVADPIVLCGDSCVYDAYVRPVTKCAALPALALTPAVPWQAEMIRQIGEMHAASSGDAYGGELGGVGAFSTFWRLLVQHTCSCFEAPLSNAGADARRVKSMLSYIQAHYAEHLTLTGIAAAAGVSASECCRCFQRQLDISPFAYIVQYRLGQAARMLAQSGRSITDIAVDVGFETPSYFSKRFRQQFGCTPREYRHCRPTLG